MSEQTKRVITHVLIVSSTKATAGAYASKSAATRVMNTSNKTTPGKFSVREALPGEFK